jgi:hypothetical protein
MKAADLYFRAAAEIARRAVPLFEPREFTDLHIKSLHLERVLKPGTSEHTKQEALM